jgi:hypothetical protein
MERRMASARSVAVVAGSALVLGAGKGGANLGIGLREAVDDAYLWKASEGIFLSVTITGPQATFHFPKASTQR